MSQPALVRYTLTDADVAGPFAPIPDDMMEKAQLPALGYTSRAGSAGREIPRAARLAAGAQSRTARLPRARRSSCPTSLARRRCRRRDKVVVDQSDAHRQPGRCRRQDLRAIPGDRWAASTIRCRSASGRSAASRAIPAFHYNPALFWDADPGRMRRPRSRRGRTIRSAWSGSTCPRSTTASTARPEPCEVGKTASHGCIRLTNWDALSLAAAVAPGVVAILQE